MFQKACTTYHVVISKIDFDYGICKKRVTSNEDRGSVRRRYVYTLKSLSAPPLRLQRRQVISVHGHFAFFLLVCTSNRCDTCARMFRLFFLGLQIYLSILLSAQKKIDPRDNLKSKGEES
ncbi:hypothetical protein KP509_1Z300100 [Ceratopteris richardii]|nr:hypothetical protein KP509_1Z300100 [Ceratopteris richardii]